MCSTPEEAARALGQAIDELAAAAFDGTEGAELAVALRLARLWAMVAELDPEVARRITRYGR